MRMTVLEIIITFFICVVLFSIVNSAINSTKKDNNINGSIALEKLDTEEIKEIKLNSEGIHIQINNKTYDIVETNYMVKKIIIDNLSFGISNAKEVIILLEK